MIRRVLGGAALVAAILLGARPAPASDAQGAATAADSLGLDFYNRRIFDFRATVGPFAPTERARAAHERLVAALSDMGRDSVWALDSPLGQVVVLNQRPLFTVVAADVDSTAGETRAGAAQEAVRRLQEALAARREESDPRAILRSILASTGALLAFSIVVLVLFRIRDRLVARIRERRTRGSSPDSPWREFVDRHATPWVGRTGAFLGWLVVLVLLDLTVTFVLQQFAYTRPWGRQLAGWLGSTVRNLGLDALRAVPGLVVVVLILLIARAVNRALAGFFQAARFGVLSVRWLHPDIAVPTQRLVSAVVWVLAIIAAYPHIPGSGSLAFKGVSLFLGFVLSLGSSGVVTQVMSGFVLMYTRAFRPDDYVRVGDTEGTILELGLLSTKIRTPRNEMVVLPNSTILSGAMTNFSRRDDGTPLLVGTTVTIGYDAPWRQVHALLESAAARSAGLLPEPKPTVLQRALADFYVEYQLVVALETPHRRIRVLAELHQNIQDTFNEAGVQIMSPHFESQPNAAVVVPPHLWQGTPPPWAPGAKPPRDPA